MKDGLAGWRKEKQGTYKPTQAVLNFFEEEHRWYRWATDNNEGKITFIQESILQSRCLLAKHIAGMLRGLGDHVLPSGAATVVGA
jgi:hypothetical protein